MTNKGKNSGNRRRLFYRVETQGMDGKTIGGYISALFYLLSLILKVSPEEVTDELLYASQGMNNKDFDALMLIMANLCDIPKPQVFLDDRSNYCLYQKNVFLNDEIYELQDLDMILREMTGYCLVVKKFMFRDDEIIYEDPYQIVVSEEAYKRHNRNKKCDDLVMMFADSKPDESREEVDDFLDKFFKEMENKEKKETKAKAETKKAKTERPAKKEKAGKKAEPAKSTKKAVTKK